MSRRVVPLDSHERKVPKKSRYSEEQIPKKRSRKQDQQQYYDDDEEQQASFRHPQKRQSQKKGKKKTKKVEEDEDDSQEEDDQEEGTSSEDSDESEDSSIKKQRKIKQQMKQKEMIVQQTKKKIGQQEAVIGTLNSQINQQNQNMNSLLNQNQNLKAKTQKLIAVEEEKNIVSTQFAAHLERVQNAKNAINRRQSMGIDFKANFFSNAFQKGGQKLSEFRQSIFGFYEKFILTIENHYFLSSKVYKISNTYGPKCEGYFHKNALLFNIYLVSFFIFLPLYIMALLNGFSFHDINSLFISSNTASVASTFGITLVIFFAFIIFQTLRNYASIKQKEIKENAKEGRSIQSFRVAFSRWNWRVCGIQHVNKNQYSMARNARDYFMFIDKVEDQYDGSNPPSYKILLIKLSTLTIICLGCFLSGYLHIQQTLLTIANLSFVSETVHGIVIAVIGKFVSMCTIFLNKYEEVINLQVINSKKYNKKFYSQALPCMTSIFFAYTTYLNNGSLNLNFIDTQIPFNSSKFSCRQNQTAHVLIGLLIGHFFINILSQLIPSLLRSCKKRNEDESILYKYIEFNMMESSVPLIVQNMILIVLVPFSPLTVILAIIILLINFDIEWAILAKLRLPQHSGLPKAYLRTHFFSFLNQSLGFCFCAFALFFTKQFDSEDAKCIPYNWKMNSLFGKVRDQIRQHEIFRIIFDSVTWYPLVICLLFMYFISHLLSTNAKTYWKQEISSKRNDINGIKTYYEARIKRLEDRIEAAKGELGYDQKSSGKNGTLNDNLLVTYDDSNRGKMKSLHSFENEQSNIPYGNSSSRVKLSSNLMTNIPSINSLKFGSNNMESSYIKTKLVTKDDYNH